MTQQATTTTATRYITDLSCQESIALEKEAMELADYAAHQALYQTAMSCDEALAAVRMRDHELAVAFALVCEAHGVINAASPKVAREARDEARFEAQFTRRR